LHCDCIGASAQDERALHDIGAGRTGSQILLNGAGRRCRESIEPATRERFGRYTELIGERLVRRVDRPIRRDERDGLGKEARLPQEVTDRHCTHTMLTPQ
jgi:hypothetical protein